MITARVYTGHEHLDAFGLIHMNGRIYDPHLARVLNPDPIIQDPTDIQNYNRYSYCLNNPLKYIDPSGYEKKKKKNNNGCGVVGHTQKAKEIEHPGFYNLFQGFGRGASSHGGGGSISNSNMSGGFTYITGIRTYNPVPYTSSFSGYAGGSGSSGSSLQSSGGSIQGPAYTIPQGGGDKPDGMVISISFDFAFGGGAGVEIGLVMDKNGGKQWFVSGNANIGYGISAGPNVRTINSVPGLTFKASDYLGYSAGFSAGLFELGGFYGGNKPQWNFTGFMDFGDTYNENGMGFSKIKAPIFGAWWSNTSTKKLSGE